ncbi:Rha family transcriptional regulator [Vagococcus carniphilus]|uniref:Rha family transcriptional regulator n=1 Tax=Vagococcus carniphilus TaxID=218144 RepID=UPI00288FC020|nr:Rha family transcriptional regulator [Vagococcus carniphilus]MDT2832209.1 Rha family transcriptional regulator [Vagococcus carniphilus]MDT2840707.1 Rha family transcriptional regulator [Vagococcus carniphilus]MDT2855681.1 Rha family transcriptional regulator [Vagococcus carniphilus]
MELVKLENNQPVTSSLRVAEVFDKQHKHVLEAIDDLVGVVENSADLFMEDTYTHPQNKQKYRQIIMNKKGWTLIAMGFTGKKATQFKLDYINAFEKMEEQISKNKTKELSYREQGLLALAANEETNQRVDQIETDVKELKDLKKLEPGMYNFIGKAVSNKINVTLEDLALNKKTQKPLRSELNRNINELAGVKTRTQIKEKDFNKIIDFIERWQPSTITLDKARAIQLELDEVEGA